MNFADFESQVDEGIKDKVRDTAIKAGRKLGIKKAKNADTSREKVFKDCLDDFLAELEGMTNFPIDDSEDVEIKKSDTGMTAVICYDRATEDTDVENKRYTKLDYKKITKFVKDVQSRHSCSFWITKHWWHNGSRYCSVAFS